jgi:serine protease
MKLSSLLYTLPLLAALTACDQGTTGLNGSARARGEPAPLLAASTASLPGRYVVVLNADERGTAGAVAQNVVAAHGGEVHHTYGHALNGFAASLSPAAVDALRRDPRVRYVAEDEMAYPDSVQVQPGATWGLDRIDQRSRPLNSQYTYTRTGQGVRVYVIDSGIRTTHAEFGGRASVGADFVGDGRNGQDCNGHGTHVAGTVAGTTYGVAKSAQVVSVRVFGCSGGAPWSTIIAAVDWVTGNAQKPAVANMSLGGSTYAPANEAVRASIASGVVYSVSAGNDSWAACNNSPASTAEALTVGSTTGDDVRSSFSNWGACVDVFAPGSSITSAWSTADNATNTISGTSMAAPHVSGVAALFLHGTPAATPAQVAAHLMASSSTGRVTDAGTGSPNKLLFSRLTPEPAQGRLAVAPTTLAFRFVRPVPGTVAQSPESEDAPAQEFIAGGDGTPKTAPDTAGPEPEYATTATSATLPVQLSNTGNAAVQWNATPGSAWVSANPASGAIAAGQGTSVNVSVNASTLAGGTHAGMVSFSDAAQGPPAILLVNVTVQNATVLEPGTPRTGLSGLYGSQSFYVVTVPAGATSLKIRTSGGSGDADLAVRYGDVPTWGIYDCWSASGSNTDECVLQNPRPGPYYVMLYGYAAYSGLTLLATVGGAPAAPAPPSTRPYSATTLRTTWTDTISNETGFTVARRTLTGSDTYSPWIDMATMPANSVRFTQTVPVGLRFQYRVRACNALGCSAWATAATAVAVPAAAPAAPPAVVATATATDRVALSWTDGSTNEASFTVTRSLLTDGTWGPYEAAGSTLANVTQLTMPGLLAGRTYRFQVNACNVVGCSAWTTTGAVALPTPPAAPSGLVATVLPGTAVRLNWTDVSSNEASFQVSRAIVGFTGAAGAYVDIGTAAPDQVLFTSTGLVPGTTYRFRVRACNLAGCSTPATSGNATIVEIPAVPTGFAAYGTSPTQIRVRWNDVDGETSYSLTRALRNADGTWGATVVVGSYAAGTTVVNDAGLAPASTYRYQLRACSFAGCSARITVADATWPN